MILNVSNINLKMKLNNKEHYNYLMNLKIKYNYYN